MSSVVPEGWKVYALGELARVVGGGTPASETPSYWGGAVMWATPAEITKLKTRYISNTSRTITDEGLKSSSAKLHPKGTILLTSRASIGYPAINLVPMATNQGFQSLIPNEKLDVEYGYQLLLNNRGGLERLSAGSTFLEISSKEINKYKLPIPPLPEQKKIASILTSVDEGIETTQRQNDKLQDLKKATMNELLTKGIGHTEFKDSELGRIPKSWEVARLSDLCVLHYGKSPKEIEAEDGSYPIYGTGGIVGKSNSALHSGQSIVIGRKGSIDNVSFVDSPFWAIDTTYYVEGKNVEMKWLFHRLQYEGLKKYNEASGVPSLSRGTLYNIPIQSPPKSEQTEICIILDTVDSHISSLNNKLAQTQSLKKSLMQDLLTGKVRVQVN